MREAELLVVPLPAPLSPPAPRMGPLGLRLSPLGGLSGRTGGAGPLNTLRTMRRVMGSSGTTNPSDGSCVTTSVRNVFVLFRVRAGDSGGFSERMLLGLLLLLLLLFWVRC